MGLNGDLTVCAVFPAVYSHVNVGGLALVSRPEHSIHHVRVEVPNSHGVQSGRALHRFITSGRLRFDAFRLSKGLHFPLCYVLREWHLHLLNLADLSLGLLQEVRPIRARFNSAAYVVRYPPGRSCLRGLKLLLHV